eukprot:scaffold13_cov241-Pinguiococcus_pyrenoidosus.AAC.27
MWAAARARAAPARVLSTWPSTSGARAGRSGLHKPGLSRKCGAKALENQFSAALWERRLRMGQMDCCARLAVLCGSS